MEQLNQGPEQKARDDIDRMLKVSGWKVQSKKAINFNAGPGIAIREYQTDVGPADYVLFVAKKAVGVIEAKSADWGQNITTVEDQSDTAQICAQTLETLEKAAPGTIGGSSPSAYAGALAAFRLLSGACLSTFRYAGVFDRMLSSMIPAAPREAMAVSSLSIVGDAVGEAEVKPVHDLELTAIELELLKATGIVVITAELPKHIPVVEPIIDDELRMAIVRGTDKPFLDTLIALTTPIASTGDVIYDLQVLLGAVESGSNASFFFIVDPTVAKRLATTPGANGVQFVNMTPNGGQIVPGVEVLVSDQLSGEAVLVDASQIAGSSEGIAIQAGRHAALQLTEAPTLTDLWGRNMRAVKAERWYTFAVLKNTAVASLSGVSYAADSP